MKRINILNYMVQKGEEQIPYQIKASMRAMLFNPSLQLNDDGLIRNFEIWNKIKDQENDLFLEDADYNVVLQALKAIRGFNENDLEFVQRIRNAENYDFKPKMSIGTSGIKEAESSDSENK